MNESESSHFAEKLVRNELAQASFDVAKTITSLAPQSDMEGNVNYYFSGSFAGNLLSQISSFEEVAISEEEKVVFPSRIMTDEASEAFSQFTRKLGDLDISIVNNDPYVVAKQADNSTPSKGKIKESVPSATKLFSGWEIIDGYPFDRVGYGNSSKKSHNIIVARMKSGEEILIVNPLDMLAYKVFERVINSSNKNIRDIRILYSGISKLFENSDMMEAFQRIAGERAPEFTFDDGASLDPETASGKMQEALRTILGK